MIMDGVTVAQRFALRDVRLASKPGSIRDIACREASYWESFPDSYSDDQVAAAVALHRDPDDAVAVLRVYLLRDPEDGGLMNMNYGSDPRHEHGGSNKMIGCFACDHPFAMSDERDSVKGGE